MIELKTAHQIEKMKVAGRLSRQALELAGSLVVEGITTAEIDHAVCKFIRENGGTPSFLGYAGYPASVCLSVNEEVIHGIPGKRRLKEGDIVSVDVGAIVDGWHGDNAATFGVGKVAPEAQRLMDVTRECLELAVDMVRPGVRLGDLGYAINDGWTVVTRSGSVSAHFENTIAVTETGAEVLTKI